LREFDWRPLRTNCSMVGNVNLSHFISRSARRRATTNHPHEHAQEADLKA